MPQDIPAEASEELAFTPKSLEFLGDKAPVFLLRVPTGREKRFIRRLYARNGLQRHSQQDIRAELLRGLEALWDKEVFERNSAMLAEYWSATDDFALQAKADPDIVFTYDPEITAACKAMPAKVAKYWPQLGEMLADNADFDELNDTIQLAVVVRDWRNFDEPVRLDDGYLTLDCAEKVMTRLDRLQKHHAELAALPPNDLATELLLACWKRMRLDEEEAGNSESPLPSETTPAASTVTPRRTARGKSPASASSAKTPTTV